jgi:DNA replication protein DnaC
MTFNEWETPTKKHEKILSYAKRFDAKEAKRSAFFYGPPGTGKTSLAKAIVGKAINEGRSAMYKTTQDIISYCKRCMDRPTIETAEAYIDFLCEYNGLLVVDEIGRTKGGDWDKNQIIFPLLDKRADKYNIWISNWSLAELAEHYDNAISSRLQIADVVGFNGIDDYRAG